MKTKLNAGIVGAAGYTGGEICRLLLNHANINKIIPFSRGDSALEKSHPNLLGSGIEFTDISKLENIVKTLDVIFFCAPSGTAMDIIPKIYNNDIKIIDLSADFRFKDTDLYYNTYGIQHKCPEILKDAVYGLTELNRAYIRDAKLIANPGCYVITIILGLYPVLMENIINMDNYIHVNAINGTTGAGVNPKAELMYTELANNILPYNLEGHRHGPELESQLSDFSSNQVKVIFNTAHGPYPRGIFSNISVELNNNYKNSVSRNHLLNIYKKYYGKGAELEFFIRIVDCLKPGLKNEKVYDVYPRLRNVIGTNFCHIGLDLDKDRNVIKIISITDNLIKGAAGSAIQNMNVLFDLKENTGLTHFAL